MKKILVLLILAFIKINASIPNNLIIEFLNYKHVNIATVIHCWKNHEIASLRYLLGENYIRSHFITVDTFIDKYVEYNDTYNIIFYEVYGFVLDLNCKRVDELFELDLSINYYRSRFYNLYKWLLIGRDEYSDENVIRRDFGDVRFRMDSDMSLAVPLNFDFEYDIYDLHNPGYRYNGTLKIDQVLAFRNGSFEPLTDISLYDRRKDMSELTISAALVISQPTQLSPKEYMEDRYTKYADPINKCTWAIFMAARIVHKFNFTLELTDKWYGDDESGITDGLVGLVYYQKGDVSYSSNIMIPARTAILDYIGDNYVFGTCFVFRNPTALGRIRNQFFNPFTRNAWFICALFLILLSLIMRLTLYVQEYYATSDEDESPWSSSWLNTLAAFCQQDIETDAENITGRIIVLSLMLCSLLLYNYYTSSIVSDLINSQTQAFTTIGELATSNLELGMLDLTYVHTLFAQNTDPDVELLIKKKKWFDIDDGVAKIKKGGAAYHAEPSTLYPFIGKQLEANEICDLYEIYLFQLVMLYSPMPKRSQYKETLQITFRKLREHGIVRRERNIWETRKPSCLGGANILQIELEQTAPALFLLIFGVGGAIVILVLEIYFGRRKNDPYKNTQIVFLK